jgi:hypothetical protein
MLRDQLLQLAKALPHRAGRRRKLTPKEEVIVVKRIEHFVASGELRMKEAQRQVAVREGVSLRTIQRICSARRRP